MIKSTIKYIILLLFIAICSLVYRSYELTYVVFFLLILPICNIFVINYSYKRISVEHKTDISVINKGRYIPINLKINNKGILPVVWLEVVFKFNNNYHLVNKEKTLLIPVLKYGKQEYTFRVKSEYCGDMNIELASVKYRDYFKLFYREKLVNKNIKIYVMPQMNMIENVDIDKKSISDIDGEKFSEYKSGDDSSQVFDIREYRPGDRMHRIHWKLSSRKKNYMVKEFSQPLNGYYCVIMDLSCGNKNNVSGYIDGVTEIALSLIMKLQEKDINHYLIGCERGRKVCFKDIISNDLTLTEIMFELFKGQYSPNINILDYIENKYEKNKESQIYYISSKVTKENIIKLKELYDNAYKKIITFSTNEEEDKRLINYAFENDIEIEFIELFENA